jgi:hypothetical protein
MYLYVCLFTIVIIIISSSPLFPPLIRCQLPTEEKSKDDHLQIPAKQKEVEGGEGTGGEETDIFERLRNGESIPADDPETCPLQEASFAAKKLLVPMNDSSDLSEGDHFLMFFRPQPYLWRDCVSSVDRQTLMPGYVHSKRDEMILVYAFLVELKRFCYDY